MCIINTELQINDTKKVQCCQQHWYNKQGDLENGVHCTIKCSTVQYCTKEWCMLKVKNFSNEWCTPRSKVLYKRTVYTKIHYCTNEQFTPRYITVQTNISTLGYKTIQKKGTH